MGADDAVDLAAGEAFHHLLGLFVGEEAAECLDPHGEPGEPVGEGVAVLGGEQGGGTQHGHLLAVLDGFERGAHSHLGLAEPDVAAHQAVHRVAPLHVGLHLVDRHLLVGRLGEREGVFHLVLPRGVVAKGVALGVHPALVQHDEFLGDLAHGAAHPRLGLGEIGAAEAVEAGGLAAHVLAQRVDLVAGHVQLVAALVRQQQVVALDPADGALHHALVLAHAVLVVHHVVAGPQVFEEAGALAFARPGLAVAAAAAGEVALGNDGQLRGGQQEAAVQGGHRHVAAGTGEVGVGAGHAELEAAVAQQLGEALGRSLAVGGHHHPVALGQQAAQAGGQRFAVAHHGAPARGLNHRGVGVRGCAAHRPHRLITGEQAVGAGVQAGEGSVCVAGPGAGEAAGEVVLLGQQIVGAVAHTAGFDQDHLAGGGQEVGDQLVALDQPGQPALHAVEHGALGEAFPLFAAPRLVGQQVVGSLANRWRGQELACREDVRLGEIDGAALVADRELGEPVDLVAPQVDADGGVGGAGEDVDDGAASGHLAAVLDEFLASVAVAHQRGEQVVGIECGPGPHGDGLDGERVGPDLLQQGTHAGDHHGRHPLGAA